MAKRELIEPKPGGESYIRRCVLFPPGESRTAMRHASESISARPMVAFREPSGGIREDVQRVAVTLEMLRQEIESGLTRARSLGASHADRNHSAPDGRDLQLERARATLEYCAKLRIHVEANLIAARRLLGKLS